MLATIPPAMTEGVFCHCRGNSGDFPANSVLEGLKEMEETDVDAAWFQ